MANRVAFQKWRIFWWTWKQMWEGAKYVKTDPERARVYHHLADLGERAYDACVKGDQNKFLNTLNQIEAARDKQVLERLRNGQGDEVPEWLKK